MKPDYESSGLSEHSLAQGASFLELIHGRRLFILVGTGGVGKTTVAASVAVAAARSGLRTLCLTIDPAHRLSQSLGFANEKSIVIPPSSLSPEAPERAAELTVMMLDAGETFDELIIANAKNRGVADGILKHRIYRYLSRHLAGTQSFMAMEKVLAVEHDARFDLVVLDTPPSERALDFFDAPERMLEILESPLTSWLGRAASLGDRLSLGFLKKATMKTLSSLGQVTGAGFLSDVGEFLANLSDLLGGFRSRAERVQTRLRSSDVGYGLVFAPHNLSLSGAMSLARGLEERGIPLQSFLLNRLPERLSPPPGELGTSVDQELKALGYSENEQLALRAAYAEAFTRSSLAQSAGEEMLDHLCGTARSQLYVLSAFSEPIHSVQGLVQLASTLRRVERRK